MDTEIRVIIADDQEGMRLILRKMIQKADGFTLCAEADNGTDVLALVEQHKPHVCFLDVEMPGMSGGMMYGVAKHACNLIVEDYCKNIGLPFVWMQFSNIYGVGNKTGNLVSYTLGELMAGKEATFGPAQQPYDFIYVDDLIEAVYRLGVCTTPKAFYYIGSGRPRKLSDYLSRIGELAGCADKVGRGHSSCCFLRCRLSQIHSVGFSGC